MNEKKRILVFQFIVHEIVKQTNIKKRRDRLISGAFHSIFCSWIIFSFLSHFDRSSSESMMADEPKNKCWHSTKILVSETILIK